MGRRPTGQAHTPLERLRTVHTTGRVTRIILDFRTAFVKLTAWGATKQKTKPVPKDAFDEFCPEQAEPSPSAPSGPKVKAKAKGSIAAVMYG